MNAELLGTFLEYFSKLLMLLLVLPLREVARGLMARKMGDDTPEREGRLTLNPFVHLDLIGSLMIMLIGFGWTKPMPINVNNFKDRRKGVLLTSLTGPVTNLISAFVCALGCEIIMNIESAMASINPLSCFALILGFLSSINVCLGVIGLLPLPQMDGFTVLRCFTGPKFDRWYFNNYRTINTASMVIIVLLFTLPPSINPLMYLITAVNALVDFSVSWVPMIFKGA
ncbi:MAG: site-2 protease family protein [Ruminococcus sp.]|nr:site-2 protease family protein [Ruminococcus sp.]